MLTITEFIEDLKIRYNIKNDNNINQKIRMKITRILNSNKELKEEFNNSESKQVFRTKGKLLNKELREQIEIRIKPYLLKLNRITAEEFNKEKKINEIEFFNRNNLLQKSYKTNEEAYIYEVPQQDLNQFMLQALFYKFFDIKINEWTEDYSNYMNFIENEELIASPTFNIITHKLKNPLDYYLIEKEREDQD